MLESRQEVKSQERYNKGVKKRSKENENHGRKKGKNERNVFQAADPSVHSNDVLTKLIENASLL